MDYLETMKVFVNVVEHGNFSRAAETQGNSASYVSKAISSLEQRLNCRLFQRSTRSLQMTEAGQCFYQHCQEVLEKLQEAENHLAQLLNEASGTLRIGAPVAMGPMLEGGELINNFLQQNPNIQIDLDLDNRHVNLINEDIDLLLRVAVNLPDSNLVARELQRFKMVICCAPAYLKKQGRPRRINELIKHNALIFKPTVFNGNWMLKKEGKTTVIPVQGNLISNNAEMIKSHTIGGLGISNLPANYIRNELRDGSLVRLFPSYSSAELTFYALYPDRQWLPKKTRLFVEHLKSVVSGYSEARI